MNERDSYSPNETAVIARLYSDLINSVNLFEKALTNRRRRSFEVMSNKVIDFARPAAINFIYHFSTFKRIPENVRAEISAEDKENAQKIRRLDQVFTQHYK